MKEFEPKIIGFLCNWCAYAGADLAGTSRTKYPPNLLPIRIMCSGRVDPAFILETLKNGTDGVLIAGCHPGDCHYLSGNYKAKGKYVYMMELLTGLSKKDFYSLTKRRKEAELGFARGNAYFHLNSFRSFGIINTCKHFAFSILSQLIYALYYFKGRMRALNKPSVFF